MHRVNCDKSASTIPKNAWMYDLTGTTRAIICMTLVKIAPTTKQALATLRTPENHSTHINQLPSDCHQANTTRTRNP